VDRHFINFYEDQYDFHSYCLRKMTLCAYVKILRFEDEIKGHRYYLCAAKLAATVYLEMIEQPDKFTEKEFDGTENLSQAELRKLRRKANKAKAVKEKNKQNGEIVKHLSKRRIDGELDVIDPEPLDPQKLLKPLDPIDEALKFIRPVINLPCKDIDVFFLAFKIYFYKNKILSMLYCLNKAYELDPSHEELQVLYPKYLQKYNDSTSTGVSGEIIKELTEAFYSKIKYKQR